MIKVPAGTVKHTETFYHKSYKRTGALGTWIQLVTAIILRKAIAIIVHDRQHNNVCYVEPKCHKRMTDV